MTRYRASRIWRSSLFAALALAAGTVRIAEAQLAVPEKAEVALHTDRTSYEAGSTARVAALMTIEPGWHVNSDKPTFDYLIPTALDLELPPGWADEKVHYPPAKKQTFAFADQPLSVFDGEVVIEAEVRVPDKTPDGPVPVRASLRYQACNESQCLPPVTAKAEVQLRVGPGGEAVASAAFPADQADETGESGGAAAAGAGGIGLMLLLALAGGLILNAMPCVLPVLSLKVFGLVRSAGHGRREIARGALSTAAGILVSFWALALAAIAARAAGSAVGWGIQFQRPGFVALLAVIVVLFCLNLWGLFEIPLPQRLARLGGSGPREGMAGHFASGLFATLMATPCSAPFLGTAVSFALAQEAPVILAIFTAVGLGMALPYLLISAFPGVAKVLPRPGAWMETVRGVLGFLLAAAAVWLFYVLAAQISPERVAGIKLALLGLALFTWLRHRGVSGRVFRHAAAVGMVATVALTLGLAVSRQASTTEVGTTAEAAGLIAWQPFDRARAESLGAGG
ncbi:MAG TPA: protein-disulfide reductase DsbD domain-containing protein, partial [Thermoanaerobaculia bacterium]|nr:protein-disulfide reductase DsbD domain-containing protein [Thermoanaerobaculia bacterium]